MARNVERPLVVRVRPSRRARLYAEVHVYSSRRAFHHAVKSAGRRDRTRGLVGRCIGVTERVVGTGRRTGLFAVVQLSRDHLGVSVVSHELFHATIRWAHRVGIQSIPTNLSLSNSTARTPAAFLTAQRTPEERCASAHDEMMRQAINAFWRRGLYTR